MPELPEVETLRRSLEPHLVGARVLSAELLRPDICDPPPRDAPAALLAGATIERLDRRGKQMALIARDGRALVVQLGMTGTVIFSRDAEHAPHTHARWTLDRGSLRFTDPRRFGGLSHFDSAAALLHKWQTLGPDALLTAPTELGRHLAENLARSHRPIKSALLDQSVLAGVGNIYADEALFRCGIPPRTRASRLRAPHHDMLARAVHEVLRSAVDHGGSTLRDYTDGLGRAGGAQLHHAVYGRGGEPCISCGTALRSAQVAQRTTVWCPKCQSSDRLLHPS